MSATPFEFSFYQSVVKSIQSTKTVISYGYMPMHFNTEILSSIGTHFLSTKRINRYVCT